MKLQLLLISSTLLTLTARATPEVGTFPQLCRQLLGQRGIEDNFQADICNQIEHENFTGTEAVQDFSPTRLEVTADEVDNHVRYVTFYRAGHMSRLGYCYASFKKWFEPKRVDAALLPQLSTGFSISKSDLNGYPEWLASGEGAACRKSVETRLGSPVLDLAAEMKGKDMLIALNPLGAMRNAKTPGEVKHELQNTVAHSRILALHVTCPTFAAWADKRWEKLPKEDRSKLMSSYPEYNWSDPIIGSRESVAYAFESKPTDLAPYRRDCK